MTIDDKQPQPTNLKHLGGDTTNVTASFRFSRPERGRYAAHREEETPADAGTDRRVTQELAGLDWAA
jgi:hypothetical protein